MTVNSLVLVVVRVEVAAAVAIVAVLLGAGSLRRRRAHKEAMVRALVRQRVTSALVGRGAPSGGPGKLSKRTRRDAIHAVAEYARTIGGADRGTLAGVAGQFGLSAYTKRLAASMFWWHRLEAARLVTLFGLSSADVRRMAADGHWLVRAQAATAAGSWRMQKALPLLITMLSDDAPLCRFEAKQALVQMGVDGARAVGDALREGIELAAGTELNARRTDGLLDVAASTPQADMVDLGLAYSRSPRDTTRCSATALLAALGGPAATDRLIELLDDDMGNVRCAAARALGTSGAWSGASALARHLDDESYDVRLAVATALQRLGAPGTLMLRRVADTGSGRAADMARQTLDIVEQLSPVGA